ncbi:MAG: phosphatase PAP2 family protein [Acidobacteriota bacterium]|nr:phosphatase PAP2 family protein [Acidobacteriota bacterium]
MRRPPRPRLYEIVLLADFVAVVLLLRVRARLGLDVLRTLLDMGEFVTFAALFLLGGIALRALFAARRGWRRGAARLRASFRPRSVFDLLRFLAALGLTSYVYSWLKLGLPLLRPDVLYDAGLFRLETALHFGVNPGRFLQSLFPYPAFWRVLGGYYGAFILTVITGVGWFGAALSIRDRARFAAGFSFLWILGSWFYFAVPSLGPCYVLTDDYTEVRAAMPEQSATMNLLFAHYGRMRAFRRHPEGTDLSPYLGIAAMPSLHVAAQAFLMFFARKRSRVLFLLYAVLTAVTFFTAVVSGWHYAIDGYAALLLAWVACAAGSRSVPSA